MTRNSFSFVLLINYSYTSSTLGGCTFHTLCNAVCQRNLENVRHCHTVQQNWLSERTVVSLKLVQCSQTRRILQWPFENPLIVTLD